MPTTHRSTEGADRENRAVTIAVQGVGLMGRQHIKAIQACPKAQLSALIDPTPQARDLARDLGVPHFPDLNALPNDALPQAVIIATPNQLHEEHTCAAFERGLAVLIEKPIADTVEAARRMISAGERAGLPLLVGFHRRHSAVVCAAKARIEAGDLGKVVSMHATTWLFKPPAYFDAEWRKEKGAGPLGINIVHDVDLMCFMAGPVRHALAMTSRATRQFEVEDTAAVILEFESGALGTLNLSDTIVAPWSYELTAGENPAYPMTAESSYLIGGTHGALDIPKARFWHNPEQRGWWENIESQPLDVTREDPLRRQIDHFCDVITGAAQPRVTGYDGLAAVATLEAIARSAASGARESVER